MIGQGMDDDELLEALASAIEANDPTPDALKRFAQESHRLLQLRTELAELQAGEAAVGAVRESAGPSTFRFASPTRDVTLSIERGQALVSCHPAEGLVSAELVTATSSDPLEINAGGVTRFSVPQDLFRIRLLVGADVVLTDWVDGRHV